MPVISFANPKGGAGKTTTALLLATELAERGEKVVVLDADPEQWLSQWAKLPGVPETLSVLKAGGEGGDTAILDQIEQARWRGKYVIVDLAGTASALVGNAIGASDFVVIPTQGSSMDARGGAKTIRLIRHKERMKRRPIAYSILLTRTSAAITSRAMRKIQAHLAENGLEVFDTTIVERAAFRDLFDMGGTLSSLTPELVSNLDNAKQNIRLFADEMLAQLARNAAPAQRPIMAQPMRVVPSAPRRPQHLRPLPSSYMSLDQYRSATADSA